jgi:hypothetical protein
LWWEERDLSFGANAKGYIVSKLYMSKAEADAGLRRPNARRQAATEVDPAILPPTS